MPIPILSVLAIGDELTSGQRVDTNSAWIAARATAVGAIVREHRTAADDRAHITDAIRSLARPGGVLVITGGLGPTMDDLTRHALADALGETLLEDAAALRTLHAWFEDRGRTMPDANRVQAMRPPSARMLENPHGTAPGLSAEIGPCAVFCMPGPPTEMKPMFERFVRPALIELSDTPVAVRTIPTFGLGESAVADRLGELMERGRDPIVGTTASGGVVTCRLRSHAAPERAEHELDRMVAQIRARLGHAVLMDHDPVDDADALPRAVVSLLSGRNETCCTVESCTGGLVAELLTRVPGSSAVFVGGLITYANTLKTTLASVDPAVLDRHGAVSRETVVEMARGGLAATGADHALAVSGVAGPAGGSADKPVGTVWIARASRDATPDARRFLFKGARDAIRHWAGVTALGMLRLRLLDTDMPLLGQQPLNSTQTRLPPDHAR